MDRILNQVIFQRFTWTTDQRFIV